MMENKERIDGLIEKAKAAKSEEELLALAKENEISMSEEDAKKLFARWNSKGELSDEELDNVAGGCGGSYSESRNCPFCGSTDTITAYHFQSGDTVMFCNSCRELFEIYEG